MKLDREKFLAAALILGATSTAAGCKKDEAPTADSTASTAASAIKAPQPLPKATASASAGGVAAKVIVAPTGEGAPPPAGENGAAGNRAFQIKLPPPQKKLAAR